MAKYRIVRTDFWKNPVVSEEMTPEDKYFYLYILTNPNTTQIGVYKITKKQMAFDLGYSIETVQSLMDRFILHHKVIRYNSETRELAIKNWGKYNLNAGGKPVMDCIVSELKEVEDHSLIEYVSESIVKQEIRSLYQAFCQQEEPCYGKKASTQTENNTYETEIEKLDESFLSPQTIGGQKEKQKEKQKQQQKACQQNVESHPAKEHPSQSKQRIEEVQEIVEFWDANGFGLTNVNAKQQLLAWLDDSSFLQPKELILKAMNIACANNKRKLNYIVGILKNWDNESLLTVEEIDVHQENQEPVRKTRQATAGRDIPSTFELDLTRGEA
ncbi:DnaD domain-containing protein [Neobacillus jeddahensis]|uniref:DnaD domain-containing protein n=1 Tax=Neobacillus jeddahensis TaxID=1461580 RepID=UPI0005A704FF|nr:DnaD domain protein [Neobacillus jeddahensis]